MYKINRYLYILINSNASDYAGIAMQTQMLLTVPEFARRLTVTPSCVRRWIATRRIAFIKVGRLVRIPESEVDRIIESGRHMPGEGRRG